MSHSERSCIGARAPLVAIGAEQLECEARWRCRAPRSRARLAAPWRPDRRDHGAGPGLRVEILVGGKVEEEAACPARCRSRPRQSSTGMLPGAGRRVAPARGPPARRSARGAWSALIRAVAALEQPEGVDHDGDRLHQHCGVRRTWPCERADRAEPGQRILVAVPDDPVPPDRGRETPHVVRIAALEPGAQSRREVVVLAIEPGDGVEGVRAARSRVLRGGRGDQGVQLRGARLALMTGLAEAITRVLADRRGARYPAGVAVQEDLSTARRRSRVRRRALVRWRRRRRRRSRRGVPRRSRACGARRRPAGPSSSRRARAGSGAGGRQSGDRGRAGRTGRRLRRRARRELIARSARAASSRASGRPSSRSRMRVAASSSSSPGAVPGHRARDRRTGARHRAERGGPAATNASPSTPAALAGRRHRPARDGGEQLGRSLGCSSHHVLAVVEHEQHLPAGERRRDPVQWW